MIKEILKKLRMQILTKFRYKFKSIGQNFYCGKRLIIKPNSVSIGNHVFIGHNCHLSVSSLEIGDFVMIASNVAIVGGDHRFDIVGTPTIFSGRGERIGVRIERDVWIGHGCIILDGTTIGEGSIIAAGTIVTKDVKPYSICAGIPGRAIKDRFNSFEDMQKHKEALSKLQANL